MQQYTFNGNDFQALVETKNWKIGVLRFSARFATLSRFERHLLTDESFILLQGQATLFVKNKDSILETAMKPCTIYNVGKGEWHHIIVNQDATVLVVENADTSKDNTEIIYV